MTDIINEMLKNDMELIGKTSKDVGKLTATLQYLIEWMEMKPNQRILSKKKVLEMSKKSLNEVNNNYK